jgi:hypothetical protein
MRGARELTPPQWRCLEDVAAGPGLLVRVRDGWMIPPLGRVCQVVTVRTLVRRRLLVADAGISAHFKNASRFSHARLIRPRVVRITREGIHWVIDRQSGLTAPALPLSRRVAAAAG